MLAIKKIAEGSAELSVPAQSLRDAFHCAVFCNPAMRFNRGVSSLAVLLCSALTEAKDAGGRAQAL